MDDFYTFFGYKMFFDIIATSFMSKVNSPSFYVKFLAIDAFSLLYRRSTNGLTDFTNVILNSVYSMRHMVVLKVLSVFIALLEDQENVLPKETAEAIILTIVGFVLSLFCSDPFSSTLTLLFERKSFSVYFSWSMCIRNQPLKR